MPNIAVSALFARILRQSEVLYAYWQELRSSPFFVVIVLAAAVSWSFFLAWYVLPP